MYEMNRVDALRAVCPPDTCTNLLTYSFACGKRSESLMRIFPQCKGTYLTRRVGGVPDTPTFMVANIWGHGSWVAFLTESPTVEHAVFKGWSKTQVAHAWAKCNGEELFDYTHLRLLRQIVDYHFPPETVGAVVWRSTKDVLCMIDAYNQRQSPRSLFGKRPFKCTGSTDEDQLQKYLGGLRDVYDTLNTYRRVTNGYV